MERIHGEQTGSPESPRDFRGVFFPVSLLALAVLLAGMEPGMIPASFPDGLSSGLAPGLLGAVLIWQGLPSLQRDPLDSWSALATGAFALFTALRLVRGAAEGLMLAGIAVAVFVWVWALPRAMAYHARRAGVLAPIHFERWWLVAQGLAGVLLAAGMWGEAEGLVGGGAFLGLTCCLIWMASLLGAGQKGR